MFKTGNNMKFPFVMPAAPAVLRSALWRTGTKWTPELRERYFVILEKSTSNHLVSTRPTRDCRARCNRYLVDRVGFIIAVYQNGEVAHLEPAAHLITYARRKGRGIITIDPNTAAVTPITLKVE